MHLPKRLLPITAAAVLAAVPATADAALRAQAGPDGLSVHAVSNGTHFPKLSLVEDGGVVRYRIDDAGHFAGLQLGPGCEPETFRGGAVATALCERLAPHARIGLGFSSDVFSVPEDFPDPLTINGGLGRQTIVGGAANDVITGSRGETNVDGRGGDDTIVDTSHTGGVRNTLRGGDGNDTISGRTETSTGRFNQNSMFGDAGADTLIAGDGFDTLDGGPGRDRLIGGGIVMARDGEPDQEISCLARDVTSRAVVDLVDPEELPNCDIVERAPRDVGEQLQIASVKAKGSALLVRLACKGDVACRGSLTVKGRKARFSLPLGRSKTVRVKLGRKARGTVTATARYEGPSGPRTTIRRVKL